MSRLYDIVQGFAAGVLVMAFIADYNRSSLPIAFICLMLSIILRSDRE